MSAEQDLLKTPEGQKIVEACIAQITPTKIRAVIDAWGTDAHALSAGCANEIARVLAKQIRTGVDQSRSSLNSDSTGDPIAMVIKEIEYQIGRNRLALQGGCDGARTLRDRIEALTGIVNFAKGLAKNSVDHSEKAHLEMVSGNLAAEIARRVSEGWGVEEENAAAQEIEPLIRRTLVSFAAADSGTPASRISIAVDIDSLAVRIIGQLSDGWGEVEDTRAAEEIKPILHEALGVVAPQAAV